MLVLSRKLGESVTINGDIVVRVHRLGRGRVALAIDAPRHVPIARTEIADGPDVVGVGAGLVELEPSPGTPRPR